MKALTGMIILVTVATIFITCMHAVEDVTKTTYNRTAQIEMMVAEVN